MKTVINFITKYAFLKYQTVVGKQFAKFENVYCFRFTLKELLFHIHKLLLTLLFVEKSKME